MAAKMAARTGLGFAVALVAAGVLAGGTASAVPTAVSDRVADALGAENLDGALACSGDYLHSCLGYDLDGGDTRAMRSSRAAKRALDGVLSSAAVSRSLAASNKPGDRVLEGRLQRLETQWSRGVAPSLEPLVVPEPSTGLLALLGLSWIAASRRRF